MGLLLVIIGIVLVWLFAGILNLIGVICVIIGVVLIIAALLGHVGPHYGAGYGRRGPPV
jgi:hypothetical protein